MGLKKKNLSIFTWLNLGAAGYFRQFYQKGSRLGHLRLVQSRSPVLSFRVFFDPDKNWYRPPENDVGAREEEKEEEEEEEEENEWKPTRTIFASLILFFVWLNDQINHAVRMTISSQKKKNLKKIFSIYFTPGEQQVWQ